MHCTATGNLDSGPNFRWQYSLFSSCSNFVESSSKKLRALEAKWKAEGVDVEALYRESYPEKTPLKIMISLLLEAMLEK